MQNGYASGHLHSQNIRLNPWVIGHPLGRIQNASDMAKIELNDYI
jgi:hypothetical protein